MRAFRRLTILGLVCGLASLMAVPAAGASPFPSNAGSFVLNAGTQGSSYAPTFTGNGLLGVRVPAAGQGYAGGTVPAQSELAGFYAKPSTGLASNRSSSGPISRPGRR